MSNFIDSHFHLDSYKNHSEIFKSINDNKIYTLCVTNSPEIFSAVLTKYSPTKYVKFALGIHPSLIVKGNFNFKLFLKYLEMTNYIGEVGLDFSEKYIAYMDYQIEVFKKILEFSVKYDKVISIHCNKANDKMIELLSFFRPKKFIMHWFNGNKNQITRLVELGAFFSINYDQITSRVLCYIPLDRVLIESDGPNNKKFRNNFSPYQIQEAYRELGEVLKVTNIKDIIYDNFKNLLTK